MLSLNLPSYEYKLTKINEELYIYDVIRKTELKLTPEEWVRQHYLNYLLSNLQFPKSLIHSEVGLKYNKKSKRADIIVYSNKDGNPLILIECKAPFVKITAKTLQQASVYCHQLKPKYLVLTNGIEHFNYKFDGEMILIEGLPNYTGALQEEN